DQDVEKCLGLLTFLPMDEVRRLGALRDSQINEAKKVLAYEVTKLVHGEEEAQKAQEAAASLFGGAALSGSIPTTEITAEDLARDARVTSMLALCGLAPSNSAARRLIQGGGVSVNEEKVTDVNALLTAEQFGTDGVMLRSGKKKFHRLVLK
ncbi:MAG TPA: tyrosine--tRNA ligase, partial [Candidatus Ventricola gallistercoris]|nr:tyrosine--tRNA ligase [Candidatus Ventricola gallistercoris]